MSTSSKRALLVAGLLALALFAAVLLRLPGPSDTDQILAQMESARAAAQRHDVGGIMKIVSADYHGSTSFDSDVDQLHFFLVRFVGRSDDPVQVTLAPPGVQVHGDTADTVGQVTVRSTNGGQTLYDQPVTLHWRRESGTKWLVFPAKVWRIVGSQFTPPGGDEGGGGLF